MSNNQSVKSNKNLDIIFRKGIEKEVEDASTSSVVLFLSRSSSLVITIDWSTKMKHASYHTFASNFWNSSNQISKNTEWKTKSEEAIAEVTRAVISAFRPSLHCRKT